MSQGSRDGHKPPQWAISRAAQIWCEPAHSAKEMDTAMAESIARNLVEVRNQAVDQAVHEIVCTPKYPASDHDAHKRAMDRVFKLKEQGP